VLLTTSFPRAVTDLPGAHLQRQSSQSSRRKTLWQVLRWGAAERPPRPQSFSPLAAPQPVRLANCFPGAACSRNAPRASTRGSNPPIPNPQVPVKMRVPRASFRFERSIPVPLNRPAAAPRPRIPGSFRQRPQGRPRVAPTAPARATGGLRPSPSAGRKGGGLAAPGHAQ